MKFKVFLMAVFILTSFLYADVTEKTTFKVSFPKFGEISNKTKVYFSGSVMNEETNTDVKGKGLVGSLLAGFYPKGKKSNLIDLDKKMYYEIDHKKKKYTATPIEKLEMDQYSQEDQEIAVSEEKGEESKYRLIRRNLKVINTNKSQEINKFPTELYNIIYVSEIEEIETGDRQVDSLFVDVFTTEKDKDFVSAEEEKNEFYQRYYQLLGLDLQTEWHNEMMGTEWLGMLQSMDEEASDQEMEIDYKELSKIKGYPVKIEGNYYVWDKSKSKPEKEEKQKVTGLSGLKSSLLKSAQKKVLESEKEKSSGFELAISYLIQTEKIDLDKVNSKKLTVPDNYKEVKPAVLKK